MKTILLSVILLVCSCTTNNAQNGGVESNNNSVEMAEGVKQYFKGIENEDLNESVNGFATEIEVNITGMRFSGTEETKGFIQRDVIGGVYTIQKVFNEEGEQVIHCLFQPRNWNNPEPPIEYRFMVENGIVTRWLGQYR